ncbi:MAG: LamG domain-containing protein [Candidatus Diapherotrites archaeon]|nr:LamG domain-containing protein [Candidatus Diapherotrites archaeon]
MKGNVAIVLIALVVVVALAYASVTTPNYGPPGAYTVRDWVPSDSGNTTCRDVCVSYFTIKNPTVNDISFTSNTVKMSFDKLPKKWELYKKVMHIHPGNGTEYWEWEDFTPTGQFKAGESIELMLVGYKKPGESIKWGVNVSGFYLDPWWNEANATHGWNLNSTWNDAVGTNHLASNGNPQWVAGIFGNQVELDGTGDFGVNFSVTGMPTGSSTVCYWYKAYSFTDRGAVTFDNTVIWDQGNTKVGRWIGSDAETAMFHSRVCDANNNNVFVSHTIALNTQYFDCSVWNDTDKTLYVYVNATFNVSSTNALVGAIDSNDDFAIGARDAGNRGWNGTIDEVVVFNKALTPLEINSLFNNNDISGTSDLYSQNYALPPVQPHLFFGEASSGTVTAQIEGVTKATTTVSGGKFFFDVPGNWTDYNKTVLVSVGGEQAQDQYQPGETTFVNFTG